MRIIITAINGKEPRNLDREEEGAGSPKGSPGATALPRYLAGRSQVETPNSAYAGQ